MFYLVTKKTFSINNIMNTVIISYVRLILLTIMYIQLKEKCLFSFQSFCYNTNNNTIITMLIIDLTIITTLTVLIILKILTKTFLTMLLTTLTKYYIT